MMASTLFWLDAEIDGYSYEGFIRHIENLAAAQQNGSVPNYSDFLMNVYAEVSRANYSHLLRIKTLLDLVDTNDDDYVYAIPVRQEIVFLGCHINTNGGLTAMRTCYYTLKKILMTKSSATDLEFLWDGIGQWQM